MWLRRVPADLPHHCCKREHPTLFRGFKDTVYPLFDSDTLFLECFRRCRF